MFILQSYFWNIINFCIVISGSWIIFIIRIGTNGALLPRYLYGWSLIENTCARFCITSWKLPQKYLEHYGFYSSSYRVRLHKKVDVKLIVRWNNVICEWSTKNVKILNSDLQYQNINSEISIKKIVSELNFSLFIKDGKTKIIARGDMLSNEFYSRGHNYLDDKRVSIQCKINVENDSCY